jgi:hypothetical protein
VVLADAADAGDGHEARLAECLDDAREIEFAAHERRQLLRKIA